MSMTKEEILETIIRLMKQITQDPDLPVEESTRFEDIEVWESLCTVDLEMELEKNFSVRYEVGEFQEIKDVASLAESVLKKIK